MRHDLRDALVKAHPEAIGHCRCCSRRIQLWRWWRALHEVRVSYRSRRQAALLWALRRGALLQQALCPSGLAGAQARVRADTQGTRQRARRPRSTGRSQI